MSIEFDFLFHGRSESVVQCPTPYEENFLRIGKSGYTTTGCSGQGAHYPSFSLAAECNFEVLQVGFTSGSVCPNRLRLDSYNEGTPLSRTESHHVKISMNSSQIMVKISGGGRGDFVRIEPRTQTDPDILGTNASVWFMSNKHALSNPAQFNLGNATLSNIQIISNIFETAKPTESVSLNPTTAPTTAPTIAPTKYPLITPTRVGVISGYL